MTNILQKELKWHGSPVTTYSGTISEVLTHIPEFDRRPFSLSSNDTFGHDDALKDMIVRITNSENESEIPVAVVSKSYQLVQHRSVIGIIVTALEHVGIDPGDIKTELSITQYGERIGLHFQFPDAYTINPGDDHELALRLGIFNSVDRSTRFRAVLGWLRFVCSNGMVIGSAQNDYKRRHNQSLVITDMNELLAQGIQLAVADQANLKRWCDTAINHELLTHWIDYHVANKWGVIAATRAFHIATTGSDVYVVPFSKQTLASKKSVIIGAVVPGSSTPAQSIYAVYQVLSWIAGQRNDVEEQLNWQRDVPELMAALMERS